MLNGAQRQLYARHLLLKELGESGQARLCRASVRVDAAASAEAASVALDYLERAGVGRGTDAREVVLPDAQGIAQLAGDPLLNHAAALLVGAHAAVEAIKAITGAGQPGRLPADLQLGAGPS